MKKLLLSIFTLGMISGASAQIVYTDINPDENLVSANDDTYSLDFNNDASPELIIFASVQDTVISMVPMTITGVAIQTLGNTEVMGGSQTLGTETVLIADTLQMWSDISSSQTFINSSVPSVFPGIGLGVNSGAPLAAAMGDFIGNGELWFGVKFDISGADHFGWVKVSVETGSVSGMVFDYAYQSTPGTAIGAGDDGTGSSIAESDLINFSTYAVNDQLFVNGVPSRCNLSVYNLIGEEVLSQQVLSNEVFDVAHLNQGVYLVTLQKGQRRVTKKIIIK